MKFQVQVCVRVQMLLPRLVGAMNRSSDMAAMLQVRLRVPPHTLHLAGRLQASCTGLGPQLTAAEIAMFVSKHPGV